jgi:hypothetical protein
MEDWERVLQLMETRIGTWTAADATAVEQALRELAVMRENAAAAVARVRAMQAGRR